MNVRAGQGQRPVTLRRTRSLPTSYPGRHGEQVEALRAEMGGKPEHATGAEREGCEGKGGQEPRVRLQSFNEKETFSCQCAHLILFPNVKPKAERTHQGGQRMAAGCLSCVAAWLTPKCRGLSRPAQNRYRAGQKPLCRCFPACHPWEFQKPLDSRPAYTSRWPFRMGS